MPVSIAPRFVQFGERVLNLDAITWFDFKGAGDGASLAIYTPASGTAALQYHGKTAVGLHAKLMAALKPKNWD
jgi:hypothetical protein